MTYYKDAQMYQKRKKKMPNNFGAVQQAKKFTELTKLWTAKT